MSYTSQGTFTIYIRRKKYAKMNTNRKIAITVGILFLLAAVTAIVGLVLYEPILNDPNYIIKDDVNHTQVIWGAFLEIILALSVIGTSITMFPILKKYNESIMKVWQLDVFVSGSLRLLSLL